MSRELDFSKYLVELFNQTNYTWRNNAIILGGTSGSGGGSGGPAGGYIGQAPQTKVAGDTSELRVLTSGSVGSLLDNLNNIRYWETTQISATAPTTTFAGQLWIDTSSGSILMVRNSSDTAWITVSSSGGGVSLDATSPFDVGATADVGTSGSASHGDHVHRGITSISAEGGAYAYGNIEFFPGTNISITQSSGSLTINNTMGASAIVFDTATPLPVGVASAVGSSGSPPHADHIHQGITGLYTGTNSAQSGFIDLVAGSGLTITQSSGSFTWATSGSFVPVVHDINGAYHTGFPLTVVNGGTGVATTPTSGALLIGTNSGGYAVNNLTAGANVTITNSSGSITIAATSGSGGGVTISANAPQDVGSAAVVGSSGSASDGAHVHRGVTSVSAQGGAYAYGNIELVPGTNISLSQSSGSITITNTMGAGAITFDTAAPQDVGSAAVVGSSGSPPHSNHVHRGVTGLYTAPNTDLFGSVPLVAGSGISITQSSGSLTWANTGVTGLYTGTNTAQTGVVDLVAGSNITITQSSGSFQIDSTASTTGGHLHGLARWAGALGQTVFDLPDIAEYVDNVSLNGLIEDPAVYTLSLNGTQITLDTALASATLVIAQYVIAQV